MRRFGIARLIVSQLLLTAFYPLLLSCTILPRSGPTQSDVYQSSYGQIPIISVTPKVAAITYLKPQYPWFYSSNINVVNYETLDIGDKVEVTIWESASEKLYSGSNQGPATLGPLIISANGNIDFPYLGKIKARGKTLDQLQQKLSFLLKNKIINPQISVKKTEGFSKQISIQGVVVKPGIFEISPGRHNLISLLAEAGGLVIAPELTEITLERKGKKFKTTLIDIFQSADKNINLHPGDNIILTEINRSFTSLGATAAQKLIKFPKNEVSLIEAIALADGLSEERANPSYIFVLRKEKNEILAQLFSGMKILGTSQVIYELNMRKMPAIFSAQQFKIRDGDLIITVDAPYANVQKILSSLSPAVGLGRVMA